MFCLAETVFTVSLLKYWNCGFPVSLKRTLKSPASRIIPQGETTQARPSSLRFVSIGAALHISARKMQIVSINYAKVNSSKLSGLEQSLCSSAHEHNQEKGMDSQGRERDFFFFPSLSRFGDVWRGCLRKSSPFTSFSLTFGKLTVKFEMLYQFR